MFVSKNFYERHMQEKAELKKRLDEYDELFDRIYRIKGNDFNFGIKIITDKPVDSDEHKFIYKYPASSFGPCYDTSVFVQIMQGKKKAGREITLADLEDKPGEV